MSPEASWRPRYQAFASNNEAIKIKWLWRFAKEEDALWRKVVVAKYGVDNLGWWSKKSCYAHGVGCWKAILGGFGALQDFGAFSGRDWF